MSVAACPVWAFSTVWFRMPLPRVLHALTEVRVAGPWVALGAGADVEACLCCLALKRLQEATGGKAPWEVRLGQRVHTHLGGHAEKVLWSGVCAICMVVLLHVGEPLLLTPTET